MYIIEETTLQRKGYGYVTPTTTMICPPRCSININHHPDLSPDEVNAFCHFGYVTAESGRPALVIHFPLTTEVLDEPLISINHLTLSGGVSQITVYDNISIRFDHLTLNSATLDSANIFLSDFKQ